MFIDSFHSVTHQETFNNNGFSTTLSELPKNSTLKHPDYSKYFNGIEKRRLGEILRMSLACSIECMNEINQSVDGIIVGTGMGCGANTKAFLKNIYESKDGPISPTSFILSTHNTIAGQISLRTNNRGYNMTHTQNSLSFEYALIDSFLNLNDGANSILVGGAEESSNELNNFEERLHDYNTQVTSGCSYFVLSKSSSEKSKVKILDIQVYGLCKNPMEQITKYLNSINIEFDSFDQVIYTTCNNDFENEINSKCLKAETLNIKKYCGNYMTNSSFSVALASDQISYGKYKGLQTKILIINNLIEENLGIIILESIK